MRAVAVVPAFALALALAGCGSGSVRTVTATATVTVTRTSASAASPRASEGGGVADVVARVLPSVVNVRTVGFDGDSGEASGVVIDRSGVILTNFHVVRGARRVTVVFGDGRHTTPVRATVIGTAENSDLAIIRVKLDDLTPIALGHSSALRLGDGVTTVGFPLDLGGGPTVTHGIVSGLDRTVTAQGGPQLRGLLQTDAAINPGDSGGALIDATGKLVGITTIGAVSGSAENIGFAIAIDSARSVIEEIIGTRSAARAWIGATFSSIADASSAVQLGLPPSTRGAAVVAVFSGSPAAKAGLHEGDTVVAVGGAAVRSAAGITKVLAGSKPGASLVLDVVDQSGPRRVTVTVGTRPRSLGQP